MEFAPTTKLSQSAESRCPTFARAYSDMFTVIASSLREWETAGLYELLINRPKGYDNNINSEYLYIYIYIACIFLHHDVVSIIFDLQFKECFNTVIVLHIHNKSFLFFYSWQFENYNVAYVLHLIVGSI